MTKQTQKNKKPSFFDVVSQAKLAWKLFRDPNVSPLIRYGIPLLALLYVLFPLDFLPDGILGLGQLDDLAVVMLLTQAFIALAPDSIVEMYRQGRSAVNSEPTQPAAPDDEDIVDVDYRVV